MCFVLSSGQRSQKLFAVADDSHAAAAPACSRFDYHRVADFVGYARALFFIFDHTVEPWSDRHTDGFHRRSGFSLVSHQLDGSGAWSDELYIAGLAHFSKVRVLCQEPVAWMDGI